MKLSEPQRCEIAARYATGLSSLEVAREFCISWLTVIKCARRFGVHVRSARESHIHAAPASFFHDYAAGFSYPQLKAKYGFSSAKVAKLAKERGLLRVPRITAEEKASRIASRSAKKAARAICKHCKEVREKNASGDWVCRPCAARYMAIWRATHRERDAATRRRSQLKHPKRSTDWYRRNIIAGREYVARRTARKRGAPGSHTAAEWESVKAVQDGRCFDCGVIAPLTRGHLMPIVRGGSDDISNIVGQCRSCNSKQHAKIHPALLATMVSDSEGAVTCS